MNTRQNAIYEVQRLVKHLEKSNEQHAEQIKENKKMIRMLNRYLDKLESDDPMEFDNTIPF